MRRLRLEIRTVVEDGRKGSRVEYEDWGYTVEDSERGILAVGILHGDASLRRVLEGCEAVDIDPDVTLPGSWSTIIGKHLEGV